MSPAETFTASACSCGIALLAVITARRLGIPSVNPISVFAGVWILVIVLVQLPGFSLKPLNERTWTILFLGTAPFCVSALTTWWVLQGRTTADAAVAPGRKGPLLPVSTTVYTGALLALIGYAALQLKAALPLLSAAGGVKGLLAAGAGLQYRQDLNAQAALSHGAALGGGTAATGLASYALFGGALTLFWGPMFYRAGRRFLGIAPVVVMALLSLLTLQRFVFVYSLLPFLYSAYLTRRRGHGNREALGRHFIAALAGLVVVVAAVFVPAALRRPNTTRRGTITSSTAIYLVSGLAALNERSALDPKFAADTVNEQQESIPRPAYGRYTFRGATNLLQRAGLSIAVAPANLSYVNIKQQGVPFFSNVYTLFIYPLLDFGLFGLSVFMALLGFAVVAVYRKVEVDGNGRLVPVTALGLTLVTMSFFSITILSDTQYLFVGALSLCFNWRAPLLSSRELSEPQILRAREVR